MLRVKIDLYKGNLNKFEVPEGVEVEFHNTREGCHDLLLPNGKTKCLMETKYYCANHPDLFDSQANERHWNETHKD